MEERKYCVYIHTSPSNKKYVGITSKSPKERWRNGNGYPHNAHFTNAIKKYGWDNFEHKIVATGLTEEEAQKMERELIAKYDTFNGNNGYNQTTGGEKGKQHSDKIRKDQSELAKSLWQDEEYRQKHIDYMKTLVGEKNPNYGNHKLAGENHPNYGKHLSEETRRKIGAANSNPSEETRMKMSESHKKNMTPEKREHLRQVNLGRKHTDEARKNMSDSQKARWTDELREEWSNKFSGEGNGMYGKHHTDETKQKLREMFSGENSPNYGRVVSEEERQRRHDNSPLKISVVQLNLDGSYIATHESMVYAAKSVGAADCGQISVCCSGKASSAHGYMWIREDEYNPNKQYGYKNPALKEVVQFDLNWNYICEYKSVTDASKSTGAFGQNIGRACKTGATCKGFKWMYKKDYDKIKENGH